MYHILTYNIPREKMRKLQVIFIKHGLSFCAVSVEKQNVPLEQLLQKRESTESVLSDDLFTDEMMVLNGIGQGKLNLLLHAMQVSKVRIPLKAVITPHNCSWTSVQLHKEIAAEHEAMNQKMQSIHSNGGNQ